MMPPFPVRCVARMAFARCRGDQCGIQIKRHYLPSLLQHLCFIAILCLGVIFGYQQSCNGIVVRASLGPYGSVFRLLRSGGEEARNRRLYGSVNYAEFGYSP